MKRDNELQKPSHILVFLTRKKGKRLKIKMYDAQKAKGLLIKFKYQNFRYRSQNEM